MALSIAVPPAFISAGYWENERERTLPVGEHAVVVASGPGAPLLLDVLPTPLLLLPLLVLLEPLLLELLLPVRPPELLALDPTPLELPLLEPPLDAEPLLPELPLLLPELPAPES